RRGLLKENGSGLLGLTATYRRPLGERNGVESLIEGLAELDESERQELLARLPADDSGRQLLSPEQLRTLWENGGAVGSHGLTHAPITLVKDARRELTLSRRVLAERLRTIEAAGVTCLSFPHGRYNDEAVRQARLCGYRLIFTSDPYINRVVNGKPAGD